MKDLLEAFENFGYPRSRRTICRLEEQGHLKCRRDPVGNHRVFTADEIAEIVIAFSPGGSGKWYAKEEEDEEDFQSGNEGSDPDEN